MAVAAAGEADAARPSSGMDVDMEEGSSRGPGSPSRSLAAGECISRSQASEAGDQVNFHLLSYLLLTLLLSAALGQLSGAYWGLAQAWPHCRETDSCCNRLQYRRLRI